MLKPEVGPRTRVLVLTGAGVSQESGVPTFRDANGLWEGHRFEDVASPEGFEADPGLVWRFYGERRAAAHTVAPNPGHGALADLEATLGDRFLLATQNVDGLHARAGSRRMVAIHGELFQSRCVRCEQPFDDHRTYLGEPLPRCGDCGALLRPHIVWFGEALDPGHLERIEDFIAEASRDLLFVAVGTSGNVYPAAALVDAARAVGGVTWLVDLAPDRSQEARFHHVVRGKSGELLPVLLE
jgi:NAD-dependent deacetylase